MLHKLHVIWLHMSTYILFISIYWEREREGESQDLIVYYYGNNWEWEVHASGIMNFHSIATFVDLFVTLKINFLVLLLYIYSYIFVFIENPPFLGLILEKEYIFSVAVHYTLLLHNTISEAVIWILDVSNKLLEGIVQILPCAQLETKLILVFCTISVLICGITCMKGIC